ncbi:hypothetical protein ARC78_05950 [Stenotrophomonas pictorum JCM 9942]|uniref:DUF1684 domain-containing protein n=1 Tax=Stenotrophomonas pictorum JCM 9942 TaxID=1236960 RepID=A0A0R0AUV5_9GAMM|nr:hypothetical protein ARC78_05950 [Stenotrophomonas pictorum JCM 9942]
MRLRMSTALMVLALACSGCMRGGSAAADGDSQRYAREIQQWRTQRLEALRAPDGWLSYAGSGRLRPGRYRIGSAPGSDVRLPAGLSVLGTLTLGSDDTAHIQAGAGSTATLDGKPLQHAKLIPAVVGGAAASRIRLGETEFYLVRTGNVWGWRYRDPGSPYRRNFGGIEHFPVAPQWRVRARWHPYKTPEDVVLLTSIGTPLPAQVPGEARFEIDGRSYRLRPVLQLQEADDKRLFFLFSDRTSGRETYGGARYLSAASPHDGTVVLDFNRAENPPCAFTPHVVCPVAPPANRLDLAVTAGEKVYQARD